LEKCDVNILHEYILEEYKSRLIERKETRRHQSLNKSLEHGFDVIDKNLDLEDIVFQKIEAERLHKALTELTSEQRQLIEKIYFKEEKQTDIARELGIDKTSLRDRLKVIYKKLKKFL
jgi:sigma-70, region 4